MGRSPRRNWMCGLGEGQVPTQPARGLPVGSGEQSQPKLNVLWSWRGGNQSPPNQLEDSPVGSGMQPQPKLNLVYFSRKIWHLVTADDLYWTINAQNLNAIRPNTVNILILITIASKTSLCPKEQLARVGLYLQTKNSRQILLGYSL